MNHFKPHQNQLPRVPIIVQAFALAVELLSCLFGDHYWQDQSVLDVRCIVCRIGANNDRA